MSSARKSVIFIVSLLCLVPSVFSQQRVVIDKVVAVVGNNAILKSDLYNQKRQLESQGVTFGDDAPCRILDQMLYQKLLFNQAVIDSVVISEMQVEQVLERRLRYFINQIGSREQLEAYYGKSVEELKDEFRPMIREQELSQSMEGRITKDVRVTPSEVRSFFRNLHPDSIPIVESEMALSQIMIKPKIEAEEIAETKRRLNEIRERIIRGESFSTMSILYSEDPGSARKGGELGFHGRGELFTEFEATAFSLRPGEISEIIETQAGYHIIQMIERRGELINVRHILMKPKVSPLQLAQARSRLDSIRTAIVKQEITFAEAAKKFSDDPNRISGGFMINPYNNTARFKNDEIEPGLFFVVDKLEVGQITQPLPTTTDEGSQAFRIVLVRERIDAHAASLEGDYDFIQQLALNRKKDAIVKQWVNSKIGSTFFFINQEFHLCQFTADWMRNQPIVKE